MYLVLHIQRGNLPFIEDHQKQVALIQENSLCSSTNQKVVMPNTINSSRLIGRLYFPQFEYLPGCCGKIDHLMRTLPPTALGGWDSAAIISNYFLVLSINTDCLDFRLWFLKSLSPQFDYRMLYYTFCHSTLSFTIVYNVVILLPHIAQLIGHVQLLNPSNQSSQQLFY